MKVFVGKDKRPEKLELIDCKTGQNWVADFLALHGDWKSLGFEPEPGGDGFLCSEQVYREWSEIIEGKAE